MKKIYSDQDFMKIASPILNNKEFLKTKSVVHHGSTRYNHSLRVGYLSYRLSKILHCDTPCVTRAATLHDFFLERDDNGIIAETKMLINHPALAKQNAINYFGISEKEGSIIESHMFPISTVVPKSKEAWIVVLCDKIIALFEGAGVAKTQLSVWMLFLFNFIR